VVVELVAGAPSLRNGGRNSPLRVERMALMVGRVRRRRWCTVPELDAGSMSCGLVEMIRLRCGTR